MDIEDIKYKILRQHLVEQLRRKFSFDERVLAAIGKISRQLFVANGLEHLAYEDRPLPIAAQQTISQPFTVAMQTHLLEIKKWDKVLEIGTGCGYQAAVLAEMGAKVYSIERQKELYVQAQNILWNLNYQVTLFYGDGYKGNSAFAPYQKIIVTCGAPTVPPILLEQLAVGGRMVIPIGVNGQDMQLIECFGKDDYRTTRHGNYNFVPMLEGMAGK
ncbi:MAG: protein-L-isoaspartate(D-aspartate) O-methyltransferase [Prevotellaceae bacterium]|jgi:protein-L-isoaspartate(D-aspartate) O-methyltransferase|nr:protein-L-isoaspartate(D-aspartate) O-methyltransferase [Prevotellaceae bacterium]